MTDIVFSHKDNLGEFGLYEGLVVTYKGHCRHCRAFVSLREEVLNDALYEALRRAAEPTHPKRD